MTPTQVFVFASAVLAVFAGLAMLAGRKVKNDTLINVGMLAAILVLSVWLGGFFWWLGFILKPVVFP